MKSNQTQGAFCKDNGLARGTFHGILKQKDKLLNYGGDILRKRKTEGKYAIVEYAISLWVKQINQQGVLPSNSLIAAKALTLAKQFQIDDFKAGDS